MKKVLLLIVFLIFLSSCELRKPNIDNVERTKIEFLDPDRHYYPILRGSELTASYKFWNRGNSPLIIYELQASCGCLDIDYPRGSIGKDDFGFITIDTIMQKIYFENQGNL